jgi:hypothetical protein
MCNTQASVHRLSSLVFLQLRHFAGMFVHEQVALIIDQRYSCRVVTPVLQAAQALQ